MKRLFRTALITAAIMAVPALALAGHHHRDMSPACAAKHAEKRAAYDANGDGKLDRAERWQMKRDRRAAMIARYDANGNGALEREERQVMRRERVAERFQQLDLDKDNAISRAEADGACSRLSHHFEAIDTDGNSFITKAEMEAVRPHEHRRGRHGQGHRHLD